MILDLRADEFTAFFEAVHSPSEKPADKVSPFPWQNRLAQQVFTGGWPPALDVPTGAGKTAAIDIAVFHLALEADRGPERRAPVRILFVVDRRLVVDDAYERANKIARALENPKNDILKRVAARLRLLAEEGGPPLRTARLRGGAPKEPDWVRTPAQPTVVTSTVDQVGSRLFFRGYGVSDSMKPVHAGLLGTDALLLLDEAHLSQPFVQSVCDAQIFKQQPWSDDSAAAPFGVVTLSATQTASEPFRISDADRADPMLGKRIAVSKPAELIECGMKSSDPDFAGIFVARAWNFSQAGGGEANIVAVVVNRVGRAREIFNLLQGRLKLPSRADGTSSATLPEEALQPANIALLTGRVRSFDRDAVLKDILPRMAADPARRQSGEPLFIVATQCIEAGADLDFDALVTEVAPLDCLRQRFGRLNRMARQIEAKAVILAAKDQISSRADDPIYGTAQKETWSLLAAQAVKQGKGKSAKQMIDFGIAAAEAWLPTRKELHSYIAPRADAPVLLPRDIELWSRTSPVPAVDPEISLYLHGPDKGPPDVEIVWRADISDDDGESIEDREKIWIERVGVCPPSALETLSLPIGQTREWLGGRKRSSRLSDFADVESNPDEGHDREAGGDHKILRWRGADNDKTGLIDAKDVSPGDIIIVPAKPQGGCDKWGWAPRSDAAVTDIAEEAAERARGHIILRLQPKLLEIALLQEGDDTVTAKARAARFDALLEALCDATDRDVVAQVENFSRLPEIWRRRIAELQKGRISVHRTNNDRPLGLERRMRRGEAKGTMGDATTEDDGSSRAQSSKPMHLAFHSQRVEYHAGIFARAAGLADKLADDVALAGFFHDAGKAHPAFKMMLYGGDELAARGPDLAKSAKLPDSRREREAAATRAGLPKGARHEVASLGFALAHPRLEEANDPELVLWLVGTHHGFGRPFFPAVDWPHGSKAKTFRTDLGDGCFESRPPLSLAELTASWIDLFATLKHRYGPWGLARLEAIMRLADHRQSEAGEQEMDDKEKKIPKSPKQADEDRESMISPLDPPANATVLPMPGLEADNLLAFLALLGLTRALETVRLNWRPRISWMGPPWVAQLHLLEMADETEVAKATDEGCLSLAHRFDGLIVQFDEDDRKNVAFSRDGFRRYAKLARTEEAPAALIASVTAEWPEKKAGGLQAAPLVMMFGQGHQNFLERLVAVPRGELPNRFKKAKSPPDMRAPAKIAEALFRPWRREDDADGFRWDPEDDQRYALRYGDPSGAGAALTMHGANRLAAIGFLSFVAAPGERRIMAAGAVRQEDWCFVWPIWNIPLSRAGIEALLSHPDVLAGRREKLRCLGIDEIFRARRIANGKFMNVTRAQPMAGESSEGETREAKPRGSRMHRQISRA